MKFCVSLLLIVSVFSSLQTAAQDIGNFSSADLKSVNVDQLSDAQIQQFLDRAKESGMTLDQLEIVAQQRGMSSTQVAKLRNRIRQLQLKSSASGADQIKDPSSRIRDDYDQKDDYSFFENLQSGSKSKNKGELQIFGADIFATVEPSFEPSQNFPTPENYILGPGDEVIIDIYGASEITYQQVISPDGKILISGVGPIPLAGTEISIAKTRIFNKLSSIYSGLKGRRPNTFVEVSLGQVRSIKVSVVGQAMQPGTYTLSSFSTIFNALYNAGGPSEMGSMRSISLMRGGEKIAIFDVYRFLLDGDNSQNLQLQDGDVVVVNPYDRRVKLAGAVKNPAIYELTGDESFARVLEISGGFSEGAFKNSIVIDRQGSKEREVATLSNDSFSQEVMADGDSVFVERILDTYTNRVQIEGAVYRPGYFEITEGMLLSDLIKQAGSLRPDAYVLRGNIIRLSNDLTLKNISFDTKQVVDGNQDVLLAPDDLIRIPSIFDLEEQKIITISGQVRNPGDFPFIDSMTVEDIVGLAGGLKEDASTSTIEVARRLSTDEDLSRSSEVVSFQINGDLAMNAEASSFILQPFDLVLIKSTPFVREHKVVRIEGEVNFPGYYALETNEDKISDLISRAGGLTLYGYPEGASLIRRTEYFRTELEKEEFDALVNRKRAELEKKFQGNLSDPASYNLIERQLVDYEKELTEAFKIEQSSDELEARIFRAQQLRKLLLRDSVSGSEELIERQSIGIELERILENPRGKSDLILRDGDLISIPKRLETVRVQGKVLYPNTVRFEAGSSLKKYVSASGGFSSKADVKKSYVVYANGSAERTKSFLFFRKFPKVRPGADIIVPEKEIKRRMSVQEILGISSSLATIALIIDRLIQ